MAEEIYSGAMYEPGRGRQEPPYVRFTMYDLGFRILGRRYGGQVEEGGGVGENEDTS